MALAVNTGAMIMCSSGVSPSSLIAMHAVTVLGVKTPMATIMDFKPIANIPPFGMCTTLANPTVASATAAAMGALTPMPCVPVTTPWAPGSPTVLVGKVPALNSTSKCQCAWGGSISIVNPGATTVQIP